MRHRLFCNGAIGGAAGLAVFSAMTASVVLAPVAGPNFVSRLRVAVPVPDVPWGAAWDSLTAPPAVFQDAALAALVNAVKVIAAGGLVIAALALTMHTVAALLRDWHGLTVRRALGARQTALVASVARRLVPPALLGSTLGAAAGATVIAVLVAQWPSLLTQPPVAFTAAAAALLTAAVMLGLLIIVATLGLALLARRGGGLADLQGEHLTPRGPILVAQNALVVLQLAGLLLVVYGGGLILRTSTLFEPDRPVPYSDSSTISSLAFASRTPTVAARAAAYRAVVATARHGDTPLVAVASPGTWQGFGRQTPLLAFCYCAGYGGTLQPVVSTVVRAATVSPGALGLMAIQLLDGRDFTAADSTSAEPVIILSDVAARRMFGSWRVVGTKVRPSLMPRGEYRVIGIVRTPAPPGLGAGGDALPMAYFSLLQHPPEAAEVVARAGARRVLDVSRWPAAVAGASLTEGAPERLDARLRTAARPIAWFGEMVAGLAVGALLLALVALGTLMSAAVRQRQREIAIRLALGARERDVVRWIVVRATALVVAGVCLGSAAAGQLRQVLREHVGGRAADDLVLLVQVAAVFGAVTLLAALWPTRRALRVDPAAAMRDA